MTERFVSSEGTISVGMGESTVVGTGTLFGGRDREGAALWAYPISGDSPDSPISAIFIGIVAAIDPRGVYDDLELPLLKPYRGEAVVDVTYSLVDGPAIANGATQASIFARFAAFLEQNMGLVANAADDFDFSLVPNNSLVVDDVTNELKQWRDGILEDVFTQMSSLDLAAQPFGETSDIAGAATTDIGALNTMRARITGTSGTITSLGTHTNRVRYGSFASAGLVIQHHATQLNLPNAGGDITVEAGDRWLAASDGSGNWIMLSYIRADGRALVESTLADLGGLALAGGTMTGGLVLVAGTTTVQALKHTAGAVLTTPVAGVEEYDGKAFYRTPNASNRGIAPAIHFRALSADDTGGTNVNTAQPWFPTTGTLTLPAATTYFFDGVLRLSRAAGNTSHTTSVLFGGTATITNIDFAAWAWTGDVNTAPGAASVFQFIQVATAVVWKAASTSTTEQSMLMVRGTVRINGAGTFIPQFQYSVAPGGTPTILRGSFFRLYPIGSNTVATVGNWS